MAPATCTKCQRPIVWAALDGESAAFEVAVLQNDEPSFEIHKAHGTYRAKPRRSLPYATPYQRHTCRKDQR
jgi:hypothetical protein